MPWLPFLEGGTPWKPAERVARVPHEIHRSLEIKLPLREANRLKPEHPHLYSPPHIQRELLGTRVSTQQARPGRSLPGLQKESCHGLTPQTARGGSGLGPAFLFAVVCFEGSWDLFGRGLKGNGRAPFPCLFCLRRGGGEFCGRGRTLGD